MFKKAIPVWAEKYVGERNILLSFTTEVDFQGKFSEIKVAADALYRVYINGNLIFHGPQRCGKGTWRVDNIDITHKMNRFEKNNIEIQVLNYGVTSFEYIMQPAFLQAEINIDGKIVAYTDIDGSFEARLVTSRERVAERYSYQRPFVDAYKLPTTYSEKLTLCKKDNIKLTVRTAPYPEFNKVYPEKLLLEGKLTIAPFEHDTMNVRNENNTEPNFCYKTEEIPVLYRTLESRITEISKTEVNKAIDNEYILALEDGDFKTFKLDHEDTGFIAFTVTANEDSLIYFTYDEILVDGDVYAMKHTNSCTNVLPIEIKKGTYSFVVLEPRTMQYIKAICERGNVIISDFGLIEYINPMGKIAKFECDDDALNRIYNAAVHSFEQGSVDVFMDCPSRERAGWLCDSFFTSRSEKDLTGHSNVEKGFLENFFIATDFPRIPTGMLPMCYPADELSNSFIPNWAMFLVIELEEYVERTGDKAMLELAKKRLYGLEEYFCDFINNDGLLEGLKGWVFVEWSQANKWVQDVNFPSNMMYYAMLKAMARMYNDARLDEKAEKIKATVKKLSFNGKFFRDHQVYVDGKLTTPEDITEVCQYYAFFTHIAEKEEYPELLNIIVNDFGAGHKCERTQPGVYPANAFIGNFLRMEVLSANGFRGNIIGEIKDYFDYMALLTGTLWENDTTGASCNHAFTSHVVRFILRDCLGVAKIDEVNKKIYLANDNTAPQNARASLPLANGTINIRIVDGARRVDIIGDYELG